MACERGLRFDDYEMGQRRELSRPGQQRPVTSLAWLHAQGMQPGDRVAACLPNIPKIVVVLLSAVRLGAVWSVCAPDVGTSAVHDGFQGRSGACLPGCPRTMPAGSTSYCRTAERSATSEAQPTLSASRQSTWVHRALTVQRLPSQAIAPCFPAPDRNLSFKKHQFSQVRDRFMCRADIEDAGHQNIKLNPIQHLKR